LGREAKPHEELPRVFHSIASDPKNRVVIMTGTGEGWSGPPAEPGASRTTPGSWEAIRTEGVRLIEELLSIPVPVIAAVNGPASRHAQIPLLGDIVLASDDAVFWDSAHFTNNLVPGDSMLVTMLHLLGLNRGRYFLLTGQRLDAQEALRLGLVAEVLRREALLPRAWELARELSRRSTLVLRYTKLLMAQEIRRDLLDLLGYGLALEGLGSVDASQKE
jgi:enoyl-CoA hydratase/carnithine racemase